ncbi:MAG: hypothetical protein WCP96_13205, partial [Methylococcaceae bacterium]
YTGLSLAGDATLAGSGATVLSNSTRNFIASSNPAIKTLTIGNGYTVEGGGNLGINPSVGGSSYLKVVNQGTVKANTSSGLSINVSDSGGTGFDNSAGQIQVANGSSLSLDGGTISGGSIQGAGSAILKGSGIYKDLTLAGSLQITNGQSLYIAGTNTNTGTMSLNALNSYTGLSLAGDATLAGSGATVLSNSTRNFIASSNPAIKTLTIGNGYTVEGGGNLGINPSVGGSSYLKVVNQGTVKANTSSGISINVSDSGGMGFDNSAGRILVANGSSLSLDSGTISGGSIQGAGNSGFSGNGAYKDLTLQGGFGISGNALYTDVTFNDANTFFNGAIARITGTITNTGTMLLNASNNYTGLSLAGDATLAGSGATVLSNSTRNFIASSNPAIKTLTIGNGYTVEGGGNLGINPSVGGSSYLKVVNQGTVKANTSSGLSINVSDSGGTGFDNSAGQIQVANGSSLSLDGGTISGGSIQGAGSAILKGSGIYKDLTLAGSLQITNGQSLYIAGTNTNTGTMSLNALNSYTGLSLAGDATLAGSGATVLSNSTRNFIASSNPAIKTLTIGNGYTVEGGGNLGINPSVGGSSYLKVVNQGTVKANTSSGMSINVSDSGGTGFDNSAGRILVANGSSLSLDGGTISGGTLINDGTLSNKTNSTLNNTDKLSNTGKLSNIGKINNSGAFFVTKTGIVDGTGSIAQTAGDLTLDGSMSQKSVAINGGVLNGTGTLTTLAGLNVGAGGSVNPGDVGVPGKLVVNGGVTFASGGTLNIGINDATHFGFLDVKGIADFTQGSHIAFNFGGTDPLSLAGYSFTVLSAESISNNALNLLSFSGFNNLTKNATLTWNGNVESLNIKFSVVPIPATAWLFGSALMGFICFNRRKHIKSV